MNSTRFSRPTATTDHGHSCPQNPRNHSGPELRNGKLSMGLRFAGPTADEITPRLRASATGPSLKWLPKIALFALLFGFSLATPQTHAFDDYSCQLCYSGAIFFDQAPETVGTCTWVLSYPCQQAITAFCPGTDCNFPFMDPAADWYFEANNDDRYHGLKITSRILWYTASALIEVIEPTNLVEESITVYAFDGDNFRQGTFSITISTGGGCSTCDPNGPGTGSSALGTTSTQNGSVQAGFGLGRFAFGKKAGGLTIKETSPTSLLSTPCCLKFPYGTNTGCEIVTNAAGIRQIKSAEGLANVVTNTAAKYYIDIYPLSQIGPKGATAFIRFQILLSKPSRLKTQTARARRRINCASSMATETPTNTAGKRTAGG